MPKQCFDLSHKQGDAYDGCPYCEIERLRAALEEVALSSQINCARGHGPDCDCAGDMARAVLSGQELPTKNTGHDLYGDPCSKGAIIRCRNCDLYVCSPPWTFEKVRTDPDRKICPGTEKHSG